MEINLSELQRITLRDVLTTSGLTERQVEDVFLLLSLKREKVQLAFYYRAQGMTFDEIGDAVGVPMRGAHAMITEQCKDVQEYLKKP